ncbi:hypothetical protein CYMTET_43786 [Cymbomonas tetramitiformis]|uniref:Uncharacterized protein n=1 Tax=Cymbomonas tetramitiformis TaxID=36881 RepID=A0AAE0F1B0_9CHLO|nr:hypothetical protein CYMTET_43786 [Cymbomonas tetramitiformis]
MQANLKVCTHGHVKSLIPSISSTSRRRLSFFGYANDQYSPAGTPHQLRGPLQCEEKLQCRSSIRTEETMISQLAMADKIKLHELSAVLPCVGVIVSEQPEILQLRASELAQWMVSVKADFPLMDVQQALLESPELIFESPTTLATRRQVFMKTLSKLRPQWELGRLREVVDECIYSEPDLLTEGRPPTICIRNNRVLLSRNHSASRAFLLDS